MVRRHDHGALLREVLPPDARHPEVDVEERLKYGAHDQIDEQVDAVLPGALVKGFVTHRTLAYPSGARPLQLLSVASAVYRTRTLRGAVSGAVAAALWALEQPLDKALFENGYDDVELLGRALVAGDRWYPVGLSWHLANGAVFCAIYTNVSPFMPLPPVLRGPVAALVENFASWPLASLSDRLHPRRKKLATLAGNRKALAQATLRHLLFGIVLGELDRRLNAVPEPAPPLPGPDFSSNGHGSLEHAITAESE